MLLKPSQNFLIALFIIVLCTAASERATAHAEAPPEEKITYEQHVLPIFREHCGSCHNSNDKKGDLVLDNYTLAMQGGASGEVVRTDGDAEQSQLYRVVAHLAEPVMPPSQPKIADEKVGLIKRWIEQGSLLNSGSKARKKRSVSISQSQVTQQRPEGEPILPENLPLDPLVLSSRGNGVTALAASPWAPLVAVAAHKQVLLYHSQTQDLLGVIPFPEGAIHVLKFSRNGAFLLAAGGRGGQSGKAVLFDVKTGRRVAEVGSEYDVVLAADISPDQTQIALGGPKKIVRVYLVETGELLYEKTKHTDWITALEYSPDGVLLATADRSNGLVVWEAFTGREFYVLTGHAASINDVSWGPDGNLLATCSEDTTIKMWEMQNGTQIKNWGAHGGGATSVEFLRDGRLISCGRDQRTKLWDANGGQQREFPPHADIPMELAFDNDRGVVFAGDWTGLVQVWNVADGAVLGQLATNPPSLSSRIEAARVAAQTTRQAADAANQAAAALKQQLGDQAAAKPDGTAGTPVTPEQQQQLDGLTAAAATAEASAVAAQAKLARLEAAVGRSIAAE